MGTVQFSGITTSTRHEGGGRRERKDDDRNMKNAPLGNEELDGDSSDFSAKDRNDLLEEISSAGQGVLKRTDCPRSPGGTPVRKSSVIAADTNDANMLQHALIHKFRSLHSTPVSCHHCSGSFEVSNASWSEIERSMVFDDPDITTSSTLSGNNSRLTKGNGCFEDNGGSSGNCCKKNWLMFGGAATNKHNGSTAV